MILCKHIPIQFSFPEINASGMKIVLEYAYTGSIKEESLTKDNIVEAFYAADYFQLTDLQDFIVKTAENILDKDDLENYSPDLLSKVADIMPLSDGNIFHNLLFERVAATPLNTIEFGRLSIAALQHLLSCTHGKEMPFATPEYEVFRYSTILAAKQVSNDAYKTLIERLPTIEQLDNSAQVENKCIADHQKVAKELEPLVQFIDFKRIKGQILNDVICPLEIIPAEIISNVYCQKGSNNADSNEFRGIPIFKLNESDGLVWDESACGSKLIIEDNGKVVQSSYGLHQNVRAKIVLDKKGIFEWDVTIEKTCAWTWIGVCASENFNYEEFAGNQNTGWVLGSNGICRHNQYGDPSSILSYCPPFDEDGSKITVHLDMNKRFTVNGIKYPEVSGWDDLPSKTLSSNIITSSWSFLNSV